MSAVVLSDESECDGDFFVFYCHFLAGTAQLRLPCRFPRPHRRRRHRLP